MKPLEMFLFIITGAVQVRLVKLSILCFCRQNLTLFKYFGPYQDQFGTVDKITSRSSRQCLKNHDLSVFYLQ